MLSNGSVKEVDNKRDIKSFHKNDLTGDLRLFMQ